MLTSELLSVVHQYLEGSIALEQLEDWLAPRLPLLFKLPPSSATELAAAIELGLTELGRGDRSENELRDFLKNATREVGALSLSYPPERWADYTESSNQPSPKLIYSHPKLVGVKQA